MMSNAGWKQPPSMEPIDGAWKLAPVTIPVREPATGIELGVAGGGTAELAVELTRRAARAQPKWAGTPPDNRARILRQARPGA
jgi:succinate-semialdehyde dehydrogenase/glutarate-semialdehyde dehydrogenase